MSQQGNHLNLNIGSPIVLFLDRTLLGGRTTDERNEDGSRTLTAHANVVGGTVKGFLYKGKETQLLTPAKDELNLWTVVLENNDGVTSFRLDTILLTQPIKATEPAPLAQAVKEANQEFIPADVDGA